MEDKNFLKDLSKYGLLKEYLKSKLLENKIQNIELNKEEFSSAKKNYMKFHKNGIKKLEFRKKIT